MLAFNYYYIINYIKRLKQKSSPFKILIHIAGKLWWWRRVENLCAVSFAQNTGKLSLVLSCRRRCCWYFKLLLLLLSHMLHKAEFQHNTENRRIITSFKYGVWTIRRVDIWHTKGILSPINNELYNNNSNNYYITLKLHVWGTYSV